MHSNTTEAARLAASAAKMKRAGNYPEAARGYREATRRLQRAHAATLETVDDLGARRKAKHDIDVIARWLRLARTCEALNVPTSGHNRPSGVTSGTEA